MFPEVSYVGQHNCITSPLHYVIKYVNIIMSDSKSIIISKSTAICYTTCTVKV